MPPDVESFILAEAAVVMASHGSFLAVVVAVGGVAAEAGVEVRMEEDFLVEEVALAEGAPEGIGNAREERDMKPDQLLTQFQDAAIIAAIAEAETLTTGEIRVFVSRKSPSDAMIQAQRRFRKLHMYRTLHRNAVLIYLAPHVQKFAIIGDEGIHRLCGQGVWDQVAKDMSRGFREGRFTESVVSAIHQIGTHLSVHFPETGEPRDELPNEVLRD